MQGDHLDSVETSEIRVTVGGEECVKTPNSLRESEFICIAPLEPPGGENPSIIQASVNCIAYNCVTILFMQVNIGSNIVQELDQLLTYIAPVAGAPLEIIIPSVLGGVVMVVCVLIIVFVCLYRNSQRKTVSIAMHEQILELVANT